jgi:hypothetical protein
MNARLITTFARAAALLMLTLVVLAIPPALQAQGIAPNSNQTFQTAQLAPKNTTQIILKDYQVATIADDTAVWSNHQISGYGAGDYIPFRFTVSSNGAASGQFQVRFTGQTKKCLAFANSFTYNAIEFVSGTLPTVTLDGNPQTADFATPEDFGTPHAEWVVTFNINFAAAGEARVYHYLQLSDEVGNCTGASPHSRLAPLNGNLNVSGSQELLVRVEKNK